MANQDRSWMYQFGRRRKEFDEYADGVRYFLAVATSNQASERQDGRIACPCRKCYNSRWEDPDTVARHLMNRGFFEFYYRWWAHGEDCDASSSNIVSQESIFPPPQAGTEGFNYSGPSPQGYQPQETDGAAADHLYAEQDESDHSQQDGVRSDSAQFGEVPNDEARAYLEMLHSKDMPLQDGSGKTVLQVVAQLLAGKVKHGLSQEAFNRFLQIMRSAMSNEDAARIPRDYYETRKFFEGWRLKVIKFDVCVNDCIIFTNDYATRKRCPYCKESRFVVHEGSDGRQTFTKTPRKRLWYFPIIPRLQRLFYCPKVAREMTWHLNCRGDTDEMNHPACGEAWKHFDAEHPDFAEEGRNLRCGICTDGVSPYRDRSNYSIWPVFLTVYNLPPEMCLKQEFIFLAMLIQGPRSPGKNLDVMLRPLIEDLQTLWHEGVVTYDAHRMENFTMRAAVMWTVTDYPGYGMVSSWSTHGGLSCPICMESTRADWLEHGKKFSFFDCHRKFLPPRHPFRNNRTDFTPGKACKEVAPPRRDGDEMYREVLELPPVVPGKMRKPTDQIEGYGRKHHWTQRSIFWELEYWPTLLVRHNLDVMHIEKNFFDNLFYTLLDDAGRTKDNNNSRVDLEKRAFTTRKDLYLFQDGRGRVHKPQAAYTVSKEDKKRIFEWMRTLKFPDGYASRLANCVNTETLHVTGMKSHDCHVFLQRLLPVAFDVLPKNVWEGIAEISMFFRRLGAPCVRVSEMQALEVSIAETICKLEKIFPPSFFDSMEHLPVHLPYEAKVCGPVQYRWMYPFERRMMSLKRDTKNKNHPEGSIAEAYLDLEVVNYCTMYFSDEIDNFVAGTLTSRNEVFRYPVFNGRPEIFCIPGEPSGRRRLHRILPTDEYY